jgi:hypothetical protein
MNPSLVLRATIAVLLLALPVKAESDYTIETASADPPKELHDSIRKLLDKRRVRLSNKEGGLLEVWFRHELPVKATDVQIKNGLTYQEVPSSTLIGAIKVLEETTDYRKQKLLPGVYTMRLAVQPVSDDHSGTAPHREFCLLCAAKDDKNAELLTPRELHALSARLTEEHPVVLLLFPGKGAAAVPKLVARPGGHQVLLVRRPASAGRSKGTLDVGLTLIGTSAKAPE